MASTIENAWTTAISATVNGPYSGMLAGSPVVEFYHSALDHYFSTQHPGEIADLDAGVKQGWKRTGEEFIAFRPGQAGDAASPVCRFYGLPSAGLDSHFYSASAAECSRVASQFAGVWSKETDDAFEAALPDLGTGACLSGTVPVFRLWNGRSDSNHRYTARMAVRAEMLAKGYISEGFGGLGVAICTPVSQ